MVHVQKSSGPQIGITLSGGSVFENAADFLKSLGKIGGSIFLFFILMLIFFAINKPVYALTCIFYIATIIVRIPDTWSDAVALESVGTLSILLLLIDGPILAAIYAFTSLWLTRWISPFGPIEEISETFGMSISMVVAIFISPLFPQFATKDLLMYMIYFQLTRFTVYMILITFMAPAIFITEVFYTIASIPLTIVQSYLILSIAGLWILNSHGTTGWALIPFQSLFIR